MSEAKTNAMRILEQHGIAYQAQRKQRYEDTKRAWIYHHGSGRADLSYRQRVKSG